MSDLRSSERRDVECSYDEVRGVTIHRFKPGQCKCRCGKRVVRKPVKKNRILFGKHSENSDFIE
jgi:hypothetical protein